ncbi:hypothetical protein CFC21_007588 [Triticum aestivum]|uniref:Protein BUD31 homolog n=3 Tax=Triticum TaxID=4564 RepID=A0A9R0R0M4_TRITD|nr:hypothetical protein CFC21_007588 [Triticum aestivum]VAH19691.1 unnamed protein product [Triticum turgidum subsp. durum]
MPKIKTSRVKYPEGWELIEPTLRDLEAKMREAENDTHDGKRKCEALWPIFRISHQKSRYIYDLYYRRKEIKRELYEFCLDQGYADKNLIAKWKKTYSMLDHVQFSLRQRSAPAPDLCNWTYCLNIKYPMMIFCYWCAVVTARICYRLTVCWIMFSSLSSLYSNHQSLPSFNAKVTL